MTSISTREYAVYLELHQVCVKVGNDLKMTV